MKNEPQAGNTAPTYVINQSHDNDHYTLWQLDLKNDSLFTSVAIDPNASFDRKLKICAIGGYLMSYTDVNMATDSEIEQSIQYRVFEFEPNSSDPLNGKSLQASIWEQSKFSGYYSQYAWPDEDCRLELIPMTGYVLAYIPSTGRATYRLWNFDPALTQPGTADPLPNALTPMDAFSLIDKSSQLHPVGNYVLEWQPHSSVYRVWSFDPQAMTPLALPTIAEGSWPDITSKQRLMVIGEYLLQWDTQTRDYKLWLFDANQKNDPRVGPMQSGTLPERFCNGGQLTAIQSLIPVCQDNANTPGTIDFMRDKIEHVVVYMLESRSMDSVLGWLHHHKSTDLNFVNAEPPYKGTSTHFTNPGDGKSFNVYQFNQGELSQTVDLTAPGMDPFHGTPDSIHQQYSQGYTAYFAGEKPDMNGFVKNNCSGEVMVTLTPTQLPVLNGLAGSFAVCDEWFSGLPGGTDSNRAIALTGSAFNITSTYEGNPQYEYFPDKSHRQSVWKVLWNNGIADWKIYWSVKWYDYVFSYQLYLKGEIPAVDANVDDGKTDFIAPMDQFMADAANGTLPKFSFLEPYWIAPSGATSYHPGGNLVPAERALNDIYEAIANGPGWEKTALVITFSKGGGLYDHVAPPKTINPWPNDSNDGFAFDVLGPRVPTIVVSPWVNEKTVFRTPSETPFSATSLTATLLEWMGIPKARWGMGERMPQSETFESVFQRSKPRTDKPEFTPPYDKSHPLMQSACWSGSAQSSLWNDSENWEGGNLPTDSAIFAQSSQTNLTFSALQEMSIQQVEFTPDAPAYSFTFGQTDNTPTLSIEGNGVVNNSCSKQAFSVAATSKGPYDPQLKFCNKATAGGSCVHYSAGPIAPEDAGGGVIRFCDYSTAGSASFEARTGSEKPKPHHTVGGEISFTDYASAATGSFTTYGTTGTDGYTFGNVVFHKNSTADNGQFTSIGGTVYQGDGGNTQFFDQSTAAYGIFNNLGGTHDGAYGGDVAFDGEANAGFACIYNHTADIKGAYGGVTSFNNNPPNVDGAGASAGNATIINYGARGTQEGYGGHLSFSAMHGSPVAANATITNYGSDHADASSAGHTLFCMTLPTNYYSSAGNATIHNKPANTEGGAPGYTEFSIYPAKKGGGITQTSGFVPTAENATIFNYGGTVSGASGGKTAFYGKTTAGNARLFSLSGKEGGHGGCVTFENASNAGTARLSAEGGSEQGSGGKIAFKENACGDSAQVQLTGNGSLDLTEMSTDLFIKLLDLDGGMVAMQIGEKTPYIAVTEKLIFQNDQHSLYFEMTASEDFDFGQTYTVLKAPNLQHCKLALFTGGKIEKTSPAFSIEGDQLKVCFIKE